MKTLKQVDIVFDGPPGPENPGFVEVEGVETGRSVRVGEWLRREDGYWAIRAHAVVDTDPTDSDAPARDLTQVEYEEQPCRTKDEPPPERFCCYVERGQTCTQEPELVVVGVRPDDTTDACPQHVIALTGDDAVAIYPIDPADVHSDLPARDLSRAEVRGHEGVVFEEKWCGELHLHDAHPWSKGGERFWCLGRE